MIAGPRNEQGIVVLQTSGEERNRHTGHACDMGTGHRWGRSGIEGEVYLVIQLKLGWVRLEV